MLLILYIESGNGSLTLAKNMQHELNLRKVENKIVSLHDLLPGWLDDFIFGNYKKWCLDNKSNFSSLYRNRRFYPTLYRLLPLVMRWKGMEKDIPSVIYNADAVIGCSFFCSWFARYWQEKSGRLFPIYGVLGDYTVSPGWQLQVDRLFIPYDFQNPVLDFIRQCGGNITVSGIPVATHQVDDVTLKGCVLLCGGGWGLQITAETISTLLARKSITRLIVVCGQNTALKNDICSQFYAYISGGRLEVYGFTENMHSIYARADIVVTKAGGLTLTEAATYGKPLIITGYLPGHEEDNMNVFVQRGAALYAENSQTLGQAIDAILEDNVKAELLRRHALALVNQQAGYILCNTIMKDLKHVDS